MKKYLCIFVVFVQLFGLFGCSGVGPYVLPKDRYGLNESIQLSEGQQLLLNIVRMHYGHPTLFLGVSSVTSSFTLSVGSSSSAEYSKENSRNGDFGLPFVIGIGKALTSSLTASIAPNSAYSQTPTISYVPMQGPEYTAQFLNPINMDKYYLLLSNNFDLERSLKLTIQSIGPFENSNEFYQDSHTLHQSRSKFNNFIHTMVLATKKGFVKISLRNFGSYYGLQLNINRTKYNEPLIKALLSGLNIKDPSNPIIFVNVSALVLNEDIVDKYKNIFPVRSRSIMGMMRYVSGAVEVTEGDRAGANDTDMRTRALGPEDIIRIRSSSRPPAHPSVVVHYQHRYYYIDEGDYNSKYTFIILSQLFELLAGNVISTSPVITIPAAPH